MAYQVQPYLSAIEVNQWLQDWITEEQMPMLLGVLATVTKDQYPDTRTIAIREIQANHALFFTQKISNKCQQIALNPNVSLTIVLPKHHRQISIRGRAHPITDDENYRYWATYPKSSQLKFLVYGPKSGEPIRGYNALNQELKTMQERYVNHQPSKPEAYVGYRIEIDNLSLYQLNVDSISNTYTLQKQSESQWLLTEHVP